MNEMSRLRWVCRRGVKELDVVLTSFLEKEYPSASSAEKQVFKELLDIEDPTLFAMLVGNEPAYNSAHDEMLTRLRETCAR